MKTTKVKATEAIGDHLPILTFQTARIMKNCQYQVDTKNEWVQWVTEDVRRTSLKSITQAQAKKIIRAQEGTTANEAGSNWGAFDAANTQHRTIMARLREANRTTTLTNGTKVADMHGFFASFLQSPKSPVKKPLLQMTPHEVSKVITALSGIAVHHHEKM